MKENKTKGVDQFVKTSSSTHRRGPDELFTSPYGRASIIRVEGSTGQGFPEAYGVCITYAYTDSQGYQLYFTRSGNIYTRSKESSASSSWVKTFNTISNTSDFPRLEQSISRGTNDWMTKPEFSGSKRRNQDLNNFKDSNFYDVGVTDNNTYNFPSALSTKEDRWGVLLVTKQDNNAFQMLLGSSGRGQGKIFTRLFRGDSSQWSNWRTLDLDNMSQGHQDFIKAPEKIPEWNDGNTYPEKSGVYRTNQTATNYPLGNKWGVVEYYYQNKLSGNAITGFQRWTCASGAEKGRVWIRSFENMTNKTQWKEIAFKGDPSLVGPAGPKGERGETGPAGPQGPAGRDGKDAESTFDHNDIIPQNDVTKIEKSGYYITDNNTQNLPKAFNSGDTGKGILKAIIDGTNRFYSFTPTEGKHKAKTFIGEYNTVQRTRPPEWSNIWKTHGYQEIIDSRGKEVPSPQLYLDETSNMEEIDDTPRNRGSHWMEFKSGTEHSLHNPEDVKNFSILETYCPLSKNASTGEGVGQEHDYSLLFQKAIFNKKLYIRYGSKNGNTWERWELVSGGTGDGQTGEHLTIQKVKDALKTEFDQWGNGGNENNEFQKAVEKYVHFKIEEMFKKWKTI